MEQTGELAGLGYHTLKFYCNEGLIPNVKRDENNRRIFDQRDVEWIKSLICLRRCGLSLAEMKEYIEFCQQGEASIPARQEILQKKLRDLQTKITEIEESINYIHHKQKFF